jgi:hypothetical protein
MTGRPEIWLVAHQEELVAELVVERLDGPWLRGRVVARDGFAPLRPVFDREQRLARRFTSDPLGWWHAHRHLRREIRLIKPTGEEAGDFLLHIDGGRASWRHWDPPGDRPFERLHEFEPRLLAALRQAFTGVQRALSISILVLTVVAGLAAAPASALAHRPIRHQTSNNWAGYVVQAASALKRVSGSWAQPHATCDQPFPMYSAFWVGLGGLTRASKAIEQIGTEADCTAGGHARAFAWYELFPAAPVKLGLAVHAGDQIAASVIARGAARVTLRIRNLSSGRGFTRTVPMSSLDTSSADWIAEAPSACDRGDDCQALPLTDFGAIRFAGATATTDRGHTGTIADPAFSTTRLTLVAGGPPLGPPPPFAPGARVAPAAGNRATASPLSDNGSSFTVTLEQARPQ